MITFHIISIFPDIFTSYLGESIIKRAIAEKKIAVKIYDPRDFTTDKHRKVDDRPYGGGPGMVMTVQPIVAAWEKAKGRKRNIRTLLFTPGGTMFTNTIAKDWADSKLQDIIMICGRYEGIDERVVEITGAKLISIGDYVLTGGELPAMIVVDAVSRQIGGVLGKIESLEENRISSHEMYTRPETFTHKKKKYSVPPVLMSGDHKKIDAWRAGESESS